VAAHSPIRHVRAQAEMLLDGAAPAERGGEETAEAHHPDQHPELEGGEQGDEPQVPEHQDPRSGAHLPPALVLGREQGVPEEEVHVGLPEEVRDGGKH